MGNVTSRQNVILPKARWSPEEKEMGIFFLKNASHKQTKELGISNWKQSTSQYCSLIWAFGYFAFKRCFKMKEAQEG